MKNMISYVLCLVMNNLINFTRNWTKEKEFNYFDLMQCYWMLMLWPPTLQFRLHSASILFTLENSVKIIMNCLKCILMNRFTFYFFLLRVYCPNEILTLNCYINMINWLTMSMLQVRKMGGAYACTMQSHCITYYIQHFIFLSFFFFIAFLCHAVCIFCLFHGS